MSLSLRAEAPPRKRCVTYDFREEPLSEVGNPHWVVAQGIPPGLADLILQADVARVVGVCRNRNLVLGEIGVDYSGPSTQRCQRFVLAEFFRQASFSTGTILVLRGTAYDPLGRVPTKDCLVLLDGMFVSILVPIFVRDFRWNGAGETLGGVGRPVFFGVGGRIAEMSAIQLSGVRAIPMDRLLVESDSPEFPCGVEAPMGPRHIGEMYRRVAAARGQDVALLTGLVFRNFRVFFGP
ncbi:uncharacterized protein LOC134242317 [Saccostrea cucullata]|uniref:uncharacterized protein LOC134242317 n=1 Tax=Saccostrea cuccullata TaxID=36930 RepID=UPI002ED2E917